jgi:hypothetical protein
LTAVFSSDCYPIYKIELLANNLFIIMALLINPPISCGGVCSKRGNFVQLALQGFAPILRAHRTPWIGEGTHVFFSLSG